MKKILMFFVTVLALSLTSCKFVRTEASVDVQVLENGYSVGEGVQVYIFSDGADYTDKTKAKRSMATDASGVAFFPLQSPIDFAPGWMADQYYTFIFAIFNDNGTVADRTAVSVTNGDMHKPVTLSFN